MTTRNLALALLLAAGAPASAAINFNAPVNYPTATRPDGVAAADFDGINGPDLAVSADTPDRVLIMFNNGDGTFAAPVDVAVPGGSGPGSIVAANFDGDADIDLVVALQNANAVIILRNNGAGGFTAGAMTPVGLNPRGMTAVNLDGDGDTDLAVANRDGNTVSVLLNDGTGLFAAASYPVGQEPRAVAAGDITGDGRAELFVTNHDSRSISILTNSGVGAFTPGATLLVSPNVRPEGIVAVNLDADGDTDLAVATGDPGFVTVFLNNAGTFGPGINYSAGSQNPGWIAAADFDGDTDMDVVVANKDLGNISILENNGAGAFGPPTFYSTGANPSHIALADLDGNTSTDIAVSNRDSNSTSVLLNARVVNVCYANCDGTTTAPVLNVNDFVCFQTRYAAADPYANCDGSTTQPVLNVNDFVCFQTAYAAGCP